MEQRHVERKLAAIVAADVAGYSRLMSADEEGTLAQLKGHRRALVDPKIREHRGEIVKTTGDGMLIEFASVVDALRCAVEIQRGMGERNASVPAEKRIEFRVGINVGDIIHEDKDIFGDGVNVAARLEALAEPGGICISRSVRDAVREKLGFTFEDIGDQELKNIAVPIHTFRVRFGGDLPSSGIVNTSGGRKSLAAWVAGLAAICVFAAVGLTLWSRHAPSPVVALSAPLPLPDKPSIAVLPFTSIGGDAKQERLADGITEDMITDLSRHRDLFVIARNSVFAYKGKAVNIQQVGRELGVRYVLEGSIQTSGDRVRVTAQLIEAATDAHVWSDRYDRTLDDIFDVQNEVTQKIAAALGGMTGTLAAADAARIRHKPPANLTAYDYYVMGQELHYKTTKDSVAKAEPLLRKAVELDPQFAPAHYALAHIYCTEGYWGWGDEDATALFEKSKAELLKAIALDPNDALPYSLLGLIYFGLNDFDRGLAQFDKALALNPNDPDVLFHVAVSIPFVGKGKGAAEMMDRAFRLNPNYPPFYNTAIDPYYVTGQYEKVISMVRRTVGDVQPWSWMVLAMTYGQLGRQADAAAAKTELLKRYPDFSVERITSDLNPIPDQPTLAHYLEGARKAGLSECATSEEAQKYPKMIHLAVCDLKRATN